jgi:hypothetical protein
MRKAALDPSATKEEEEEEEEVLEKTTAHTES